MKRIWLVLLLVTKRAMLLAATADGSGAAGTMPWDAPLQKIQAALAGPTLRVISIILIIVAGIFIATSEGSGVKKKGAWIIIGIAVAANATSFFNTLFPTSGGTLLW